MEIRIGEKMKRQGQWTLRWRRGLPLDVQAIAKAGQHIAQPAIISSFLLAAYMGQRLGRDFGFLSDFYELIGVLIDGLTAVRTKNDLGHGKTASLSVFKLMRS
jgi:hypothetical protein